MYICNIVVQEPLGRIVEEPNDIMCIDPQITLYELKGSLLVSYINSRAECAQPLLVSAMWDLVKDVQ
jgi:hypothetical protein